MTVVDVLVLKPVVATVGIAAVLLLLEDLVRGELGVQRTRGRIGSRTRALGLMLVVVFSALSVLRFWAVGVA